jgi:hypothetical protein
MNTHLEDLRRKIIEAVEQRMKQSERPRLLH